MTASDKSGSGDSENTSDEEGEGDMRGDAEGAKMRV